MRRTLLSCAFLLPAIPILLAVTLPAQQVRQDNGRMVWIGSDRNRQFTDQQIEFLVDRVSSIVIAQFHAGFDIDAHHELARRVKALDPTVRIFGYMSGTYIKTRFEWLSDFNPDWILKDNNGQPIVHKFRESGEVAAYFADLSKPAYRKRIAEIAAGWMEIAPYDGIIFDASNYVHGNVRRTFMDAVPPHPRQRTRFRDLISQGKMDAVNAGLEALFRETKAAIGDKLVVWNGFWRKRHTIDRSLGLMPIGDVAVAERWSIQRPMDPGQTHHSLLSRAEILEDLGIVKQGLELGKSFFLKDTFDHNWYPQASPEALAKLARFGWAMYMMIREPGRVSYGLSPGPRYSLNTDSDPVLLDATAFGAALGPFEDLGNVLTRSFERGVVYMNPTTSPVTVTIGDSLKLLHGVGIPPTVEAGSRVTIPAQDAVLFMTEGRVAWQFFRVPPHLRVTSGDRFGMRAILTTTDIVDHLPTRSIHVRDAEPGDTVEVRILSASPAGSGLLPSACIGVAPPPDRPWPPALTWIHEGAADNQWLEPGTSVYLPVHVPGAQLQVATVNKGDGAAFRPSLGIPVEVDLEVRLLKQVIFEGPRAETPTSYITMGMNQDLSTAAVIAIEEMVQVLTAVRGLTIETAYYVCSLAAQLRITRHLGQPTDVRATLPKSLFGPGGEEESDPT